MEGAGRIGEIASEAAAGARAFRPRFPWLTGDLQTVRNMIVRPRPSFADAPAQRLAFAMEDGTGDVLLGDLHVPKPQGALSTAKPTTSVGLTERWWARRARARLFPPYFHKFPNTSSSTPTI